MQKLLPVAHSPAKSCRNNEVMRHRKELGSRESRASDLLKELLEIIANSHRFYANWLHLNPF